MPRLWVRVSVTVAALVGTACSVEPPFARTNPMDSGSNYDVIVHGPDSVHSLGERFTLTLSSTPVLPDGDYELVWEASPHIECLPKNAVGCIQTPTEVATVAGEGEFEVIDMRAEYRTIAVSVYFGRKVFSHLVTIGQKAVAMQLSCSATGPVDPCDDEPFFRADTISVYPRMVDARGNPIVKKIGFGLQRGSIVSRNRAVIMPVPVDVERSNAIRVETRSGGTTWLVVHVDEATDSIRVAVRP